jgi:hypothetical protein
MDDIFALLQQSLKPEDIQKLQGLLSFTPNPEEKQKALTYGLIGAGLGILGANAQNPRGAGQMGPLAGAMPGLQMYQQTLQNAPKERLANIGALMQIAQFQKQLQAMDALKRLSPQLQTSPQSALEQGASQGDIGPTVTNAARMTPPGGPQGVDPIALQLAIASGNTSEVAKLLQSGYTEANRGIVNRGFGVGRMVNGQYIPDPASLEQAIELKRRTQELELPYRAPTEVPTSTGQKATVFPPEFPSLMRGETPQRYGPVNNPGNLRPPGQSTGFQQFNSPDEGLAALDRNLQSYGNRGLNTIEKIVSRWAPPSENDTQAYIDSVSKRLGISPTQPIDLKNPVQRQAVASAITLHEQGPKLFAQSGVGTIGLSQSQPEQIAQERQRAEQGEYGKRVGSAAGTVMEDAAKAAVGNRYLDMMVEYAKDFTPGKLAPMRSTLTQWAQALNIPISEEDRRAAGSIQGLTSMAIKLAGQATRQSDAQPSQLQYFKILESMPNEQRTIEGFNKIVGYMRDLNNLNIAKAQELRKWQVEHQGSAEGFEAAWPGMASQIPFAWNTSVDQAIRNAPSNPLPRGVTVRRVR